MANRKQRRAGKQEMRPLTVNEGQDLRDQKPRSAKPNPGGEKMTNALREIGEKIAAASEAAKARQGQGGHGGIDMPMPDNQNIGKEHITWQWRRGFFVVEAIFIKSDDNMWQKPAETYWVSVNLEKRIGTLLDAEQAKELAGVMGSAYQWESRWTQHAGQYLAHDGVLPPVEDEDCDDTD